MRSLPRANLSRALSVLVATITLTLGVTLLAAVPSYAGNKVTPGNFTGYGFDQCLTPTQEKMDVWLEYSPFLAAGIYTSGDSRACRDQPNLTPAWVSTQLAKGWRLMPITLGPQASCSTRFPRYGSDPVINDTAGADGLYANARAQGVAEATKAVQAAQKLGIVAGSTLWYDIEAYDHTQKKCRESALAFLSAWTNRLHALKYVSGVYSSAGSGILVLDQARAANTPNVTLPDYIWVARWDNIANTSTSYISEEGWNPHRRVKQYMGGHNETWGGVTINIDRNFLDVGKGSVARKETHCNGKVIDFPVYRTLKDSKKRPAAVVAFKCLMKERGYYQGKITLGYGPKAIRAANKWQARHGMKVKENWTQRNWVGLLSQGKEPTLKFGSAGKFVRRIQRSMNAAKFGPLEITGVYNRPTVRAVRKWQRSVGIPATGVVSQRAWDQLHLGRY